MKSKQLLALLLALVVVAAACGGSEDAGAADDGDRGSEVGDEQDSDDVAAPAAGFPVTIQSDGGTWTLQSAPQRIVSLSPTATELLFAIGAGDQVIAADAFSTYPPEAPTTDLSGFDPNVEAVTSYEPDLVVLSNDANDLVASLAQLGIPVLISPAPADLEQGYDDIAVFGIATGRVDETAAVVSEMRAEMEAALADAPTVAVRVYHELDETFYTASSNSFIGAVYAAMGADNIADEADADGFGFPQLTEEYIVEADPQVIVITDEVSYTPADVAARPGWGQIAAVEDGNILVVESDLASRWGPRLPQFVVAVAEAFAVVELAGAGS